MGCRHGAEDNECWVTREGKRGSAGLERDSGLGSPEPVVGSSRSSEI